MNRIGLGIAAAIALGSAAMIGMPANAAFRQIYANDFSSPSLAGWNVYNTPFYRSSRCFSSSNVNVRGGILSLTGHKAPSGPCARNRVGSGGLDTARSHIVRRGGRWEVRAKLGSDDGFDSYFGLFTAGTEFWPWEIDFPEHLGRLPRLLHFGQHFRVNGVHQQIAGDISGTLSQWEGQFNNYAIEVIPTRFGPGGTVRYFLNGRLVRTQPLKSELKEIKLAAGYLDGEPGSWIGSANGVSRSSFQIDSLKIFQYY